MSLSEATARATAGPPPVLEWRRAEDRPLVLLGGTGLAVLGFVLAVGGTISLPLGGAVSLLWPAVAVQFVASLWLGWPGVLVGVVFPVFSNLLVADAATAAFFTLPNFFQSVAPLVLFRLGRRDPALPRWSDALWLLAASALASVTAATLGGASLLFRGETKDEAFRLAQAWALTNTVVGFAQAWPLIRFVTPVLREVAAIQRRTGRLAFGVHLLGAVFSVATVAVGIVVALHVLQRRGLGLPLESVPGVMAVLLLPAAAAGLHLLWKLLAVPLETLLADGVVAAHSGSFPPARKGEVAEFEYLRQRLAGLLATVREREQRFASLFAAVGEPVMVVDLEGKLLDANPAFERAFGIPVENAKGRNLAAFNDRHSRPVLRRFLAERPQEGVLTLRTRARTARGVRELQLTATPWKDASDVLAGYCVVTTDLTEQEERERHAEAEKRFASLSHLTASLAHELNNALQVAHNTLALGETEDPSAAPRIRELRQVLNRLGHLVHRLQLVSREPHKVPSEVFAASELAVGVERAASGTPVPVRVEVPAPEVYVRGNRGLLVEAVEAVVRNALEASPPGGEVVVRIGGKSHPSEGGGRPPRVVVEVQDRGEGIPPGQEQLVFEPFFTTRDRSEHLGLGLTLAKQAVEHAGGQVSLHRRPEGGTIVRLELPVVEPSETVTPSAPPSSAPFPAKRRLLVVDDDPELVSSLGQLLAALGYEATPAKGGEEAMALLETQGHTFHGVILDLLMPGVSGFQVLAHLRQRFPHLPVVLSSGFAPDSQVQEAMAFGPTLFLQKPYSVTQLEQALTRLFAAAPGQE